MNDLVPFPVAVDYGGITITIGHCCMTLALQGWYHDGC